MAQEKALHSTTLNFGKVDYHNIGRRDCPVKVRIELRVKKGVSPHLTIDLEPIGEHVELSICGEVWQANGYDIHAGGQCYDTLTELLPNNKKLAEIVKVWKRWHLNGLKAGTRRQAAVIDAYKQQHPAWRYDYTEACAILKDAGLYEDTSKLTRAQRLVNHLLKQGRGYGYGHGWLVEPLPDHVIEQVKGW